MKVDEDLLRYVLCLLRVAQDAVGDSHHAGVLSREERFERLVVATDGGHPTRL
jgi:hypothetical protein